MEKRTGKIIFICLGCLPILFLQMIYNKSLESFIALGICNLLAIIAAGLGNLGETLQRNERRTVFLFGGYYSLFAMCFLIMFVSVALKEHIDKLFIFIFILCTFIILFTNAKGILKYRK